MIDHYRERFPGCRIVVYDNISTDNTAKIALANGCEVIPYDTNNKLHDNRYLEIKNNCWKSATTDWVLVCDLDELLDINEAELKEEAKDGTSVIRSEGYDMVDMENKVDIAGMKYGVRDVGQDKSCLFKKKFISEINYDIGCHACFPKGRVAYSKRVYKLYHYCYINYSLTVERYRVYRARINPEDIKNGCSFYGETPEEIRAIYTKARNQAIRVR